MAVSSKDKDGNLHIQFYDFADPDNDPAHIDNGTIDRFEMLAESDVRGIIDGEGGFNMYNSAPGIFAAKSSGGGSFDYSMGGGMRKYMKSKGREDK